MKNCNSFQKYKKHLRTLYFKNKQNYKKERNRNILNGNTNDNFTIVDDIVEIIAPKNFCLTDNTYECMKFFSKMRAHYKNKGHTRITLSLDCSKVEKLDFSTVILFKAVIRELKNKRLLVKGNFPNNKECKKFLIDAGFLKDLYDSKGHKFKDNGTSIILKIERGQGILTTKQSKDISELLNNASQYLWNEYIPQIRLKAVLKEICGNSIEWGDAFHKFWMIGAKFDDENDKKVTFVAVDLGQGILNSLNRKFATKIIDWFTKDDIQILDGAFDRKYGSSTAEINRNNGLPSIKGLMLGGEVRNLCVITNNVLLNFEDKDKSITFAKKRNSFMGTLYTWELNVKCQKN